LFTGSDIEGDSTLETMVAVNDIITYMERSGDLGDSAKAMQYRARIAILDMCINSWDIANDAYDKMEEASKPAELGEWLSGDYVGIAIDKFSWNISGAEKEYKKLQKEMDKLAKKSYGKILDDIVKDLLKDDDLREKLEQDAAQGKGGKSLYEKIAKKIRTQRTKTIVDPSGYVYETVPGNRISGVTATVYFEDDFGQMQWWDAEEYNQINPLLTDEEGKYAWDVPEGIWQVRYEKEGYLTAFSDKLPVPPPQLEVNIEMVSNLSAQISSVEATTEGIKVKFDKYLLSDTILQDSITVKSGGSTVEIMPVLENILESSYGKVVNEILITPKEDVFSGGTHTISFSTNIKTYAGVELSVDDYSVNIDGEIKEKAITFDKTTNTATIKSEKEYKGAIVFFATYNNGKLVSLKKVDKDLIVGENTATPEDFSIDGADTVKVMVWESSSNIKPLFEVCVVELK